MIIDLLPDLRRNLDQELSPRSVSHEKKKQSAASDRYYAQWVRDRNQIIQFVTEYPQTTEDFEALHQYLRQQDENPERASDSLGNNPRFTHGLYNPVLISFEFNDKKQSQFPHYRWQLEWFNLNPDPRDFILNDRTPKSVNVISADLTANGHLFVFGRNIDAINITIDQSRRQQLIAKAFVSPATADHYTLRTNQYSRLVTETT